MPFLVWILWFAAVADQPFERGVALFNQHRYAEAIPLLEQVNRSEQPGSERYDESAMLIGQSYYMLSKAPLAIPWLEKVRPNNESSYMLGYAYHQAGQNERSVQAFARLFGLNPQSAAAHLLTGQMLIKRQLEDAGAAEIRTALRMSPNLPEAHYLLGEIALFHGRIAEGREEFERELAINPNFSMAWHSLGDACLRESNWDAAIGNLQRAVWLNANYSGSYILLGKCYSKKGDSSKAERYLRQAVHLDPANYMANYLLGQTLVSAGRAEEGREFLKRSAVLRKSAPATAEN